MKSYALHDTVHELLSSFAAKPNGSLLITGKKGSGLTMAIDYILNSIYGPNERPGEVIRIENGGVQDVRDVLIQISKSRVNTRKPRLIIIDNAQKLTVEAQNALLKSLEEPNDSTHFVLATSEESLVLQTIKSRCFSVKLRRPSVEDLKQVFSKYSEAQFDNAYLMADGWPGTMRSILENENSEVTKQITLAKTFLGSSREDKLAMVIKCDKESIKGLIEGLVRISNASMRKSAENGNLENSKKWQEISTRLFVLVSQLENGLNPKLAGLSIALGV